jgi:hypothetical protein
MHICDYFINHQKGEIIVVNNSQNDIKLCLPIYKIIKLVFNNFLEFMKCRYKALAEEYMHEDLKT